MRESAFGGGAAAGGAFDQPALQEIGLVDVLDRVLLLSDHDREGGEPDRAAAELVAYRPQDLPVQAIEAFVVDLQEIEGGRRQTGA